MKNILILLLLILMGCTDKYIGEKKNKKTLEGERVPVIELKDEIDYGEDYNVNIVLPKPVMVEEWHGAGGLSHNSLQHIASKARFEKDYTSDIGSGSSYRDRLLAEPIVVGDSIYTLDAEAVVKQFRFSDGKKLWSKRIEPIFSSNGQVLKGSGLAYDNGILFVSLGSGEIHAFSEDNHKEIWKKTLPSPLRSSTLIYGNRVYALSADNKVNVLSSKTGEDLWNIDFGAEGAVIMGVSTPSADMGIVLFGLSVGEVVALRSDNGSFLWRASNNLSFSYNTIENMHDIKGRIIIENGKVFVSSNVKTSALDLKDGSLIWEKDIGSINNPFLSGDYLFILSNENYILTMLEKNGEIVAGIKLPLFLDEQDKTDRIFWTGPMLIEDKIAVAGTNGEIRLYSPYTGELLKKINEGDSFSIPMIAVKDKVIFIKDNAELLVYK